jgi:hypothetical protein
LIFGIAVDREGNAYVTGRGTVTAANIAISPQPRARIRAYPQREMPGRSAAAHRGMRLRPSTDRSEPHPETHRRGIRVCIDVVHDELRSSEQLACLRASDAQNPQRCKPGDTTG